MLEILLKYIYIYIKSP